MGLLMHEHTAITRLSLQKFQELNVSEYFDPTFVIWNAHPRLGMDNSKPDAHRLMCKTIDYHLPLDGDRILPEECLVVEQSMIGVLAGRRAGMQVAWVPNPNEAEKYKGMEKQYLVEWNKVFSETWTWMIPGVPGGKETHFPRAFEYGGEALQYSTMRDFPYEKYGIDKEGLAFVKYRAKWKGIGPPNIVKPLEIT
jgi:hypothetical protein